MSEIKVGDTVWAGPCVVTWTQDGYASTVSIGNFGAHVDDDYLIPDVPGLPALAAIIAEVGAEAISFAFEDADTALRNWHDGLADEGTAADLRDIELVDASRDILRRLAAALEVK